VKHNFAKLQLIVDSSNIDLGKVSCGQKAIASFVLKNVHSKIIHISKPMSSCGCTEMKVVENELRPQKCTDIFVNVDTGNSIGVYVVSILVPYQVNLDKTKKYLNLVVKFEVECPVI
jgi:hypothetical protein